MQTGKKVGRAGQPQIILPIRREGVGKSKVVQRKGYIGGGGEDGRIW